MCSSPPPHHFTVFNMCSFTSAAAASANRTAQLSSDSHRRLHRRGLAAFDSLRILYLVTHGIFLPVRALKVARVRVELGEKQNAPPQSWLRQGIRSSELFRSRSVLYQHRRRSSRTRAQQAATTLRGDSDRTRHMSTVCKSVMYVNRASVKFLRQMLARGVR